jgi:hypothetical protein
VVVTITITITITTTTNTTNTTTTTITTTTTRTLLVVVVITTTTSDTCLRSIKSFYFTGTILTTATSTISYRRSGTRAVTTYLHRWTRAILNSFYGPTLPTSTSTLGLRRRSPPPPESSSAGIRPRPLGLAYLSDGPTWIAGPVLAPASLWEREERRSVGASSSVLATVTLGLGDGEPARPRVHPTRRRRRAGTTTTRYGW